MNSPAPVETINLKLDEILVPPDRLRDADPDKVAEMIVSLRERGQLQPIEVLPASDDGMYPLNIGLHRLLGARSLGWETLRAQIFDGSPLEARLREIDENLYRAELNPLDQGVFLAERRQIYEQLHGLVKRGGDRRKSKGTNLSQRSFFDDTTEQFGLSRKMVQRALTRFSKLTPEMRRTLRGTRTARVASEIDALAKLAPTEQFEVAKLLAGEKPPKNVATALAKVRGVDRRSLHIVKTATDRMIAIWEDRKTSTDDRKAFIDWLTREGFVHGAKLTLKGRS
jgi:ParB family chromosome partitioning protein